MKKVVLLFMVLMALTGCHSKQATSPASEGNGGSNEQTSYTTAIDSYLVGLGKQYAAGEHCVPVRSIVAVASRIRRTSRCGATSGCSTTTWWVIR